MIELKVIWTGEYPCLCSGEWVIIFNNINLNIPEDKRTKPMNTFKKYKKWYFNEECMDCHYTVEVGLNFDDWIVINRYWIEEMFKAENIKINEDLLKDLYLKINLNDWIKHSCGGCI